MARVSCFITSTRRSCPLTESVMRRSTDPGAEGWPSTGVVRNRYAEDEATAPAAMTPLMKPRRETDSWVSSDIFLSSIAGSPRRVGNRPRGEGFGPAHDNPVRASGAIIFHPEIDVSECHGQAVGRREPRL